MGDDGAQLVVGIVEVLGGHEVVVVHVVDGLFGLAVGKDAHHRHPAGDEQHDDGQQEDLGPYAQLIHSVSLLI